MKKIKKCKNCRFSYEPQGTTVKCKNLSIPVEKESGRDCSAFEKKDKMKKNKKEPKPVKHKISGMSDDELLVVLVKQSKHEDVCPICNGKKSDEYWFVDSGYKLEDIKKEILERMTPKTSYKNEKR